MSKIIIILLSHKKRENGTNVPLSTADVINDLLIIIFSIVTIVTFTLIIIKGSIYLFNILPL